MQKSLSAKKTIDPPPAIYHLAKQAELGELRKVYTIVRGNTTIFGIGMLFAFFGFLLLLLKFEASSIAPLCPDFVSLCAASTDLMAGSIQHVNLFDYSSERALWITSQTD